MLKADSQDDVRLDVVVSSMAHCLCECPLYTSIIDKFQPLFEKVISGCLESFFEVDHQVDIGLYLMEATALASQTKESPGLTRSWCTLNPVSLSASQTPKSIYIFMTFLPQLFRI